MLAPVIPSPEALVKKLSFLLTMLAVLIAAPASAQTRSVWIDDLTWVEVRDAIAAGKTTAIIFVGSSEQNGPHMAIGKHNFIARYCAEQIAGKLGDALVYPIIPFAITGDAAAKTAHMRFPGSVTLPPDVFSGLVRAVAQSALAAGFKLVALMGDHGGGQERWRGWRGASTHSQESGCARALCRRLHQGVRSSDECWPGAAYRARELHAASRYVPRCCSSARTSGSVGDQIAAAKRPTGAGLPSLAYRRTRHALSRPEDSRRREPESRRLRSAR
jgi:hypothetical protein